MGASAFDGQRLTGKKGFSSLGAGAQCFWLKISHVDRRAYCVVRIAYSKGRDQGPGVRIQKRHSEFFILNFKIALRSAGGGDYVKEEDYPECNKGYSLSIELTFPQMSCIHFSRRIPPQFHAYPR